MPLTSAAFSGSVRRPLASTEAGPGPPSARCFSMKACISGTRSPPTTAPMQSAMIQRPRSTISGGRSSSRVRASQVDSVWR